LRACGIRGTSLTLRILNLSAAQPLFWAAELPLMVALFGAGIACAYVSSVPAYNDGASAPSIAEGAARGWMTSDGTCAALSARSNDLSSCFRLFPLHPLHVRLARPPARVQWSWRLLVPREPPYAL